MRTSVIGLAFAAIFPAAAFADEARPAKPDCTCRAPGGRYELGQTACLLGFVHVCEMVQNVTNWRSTGAACPEARGPSSDPAGLLPLPLAGEGRGEGPSRSSTAPG